MNSRSPPPCFANKHIHRSFHLPTLAQPSQSPCLPWLNTLFHLFQTLQLETTFRKKFYSPHTQLSSKILHGPTSLQQATLNLCQLVFHLKRDSLEQVCPKVLVKKCKSLTDPFVNIANSRIAHLDDQKHFQHREPCLQEAFPSG